MKYILGKKIEMTRVWKGESVVPVTKVQAGPCRVVQIKTKERDGYDAVQIGYGEKKEKNTAKPQQGHFSGLANFRWTREFRYDFDRTPADKSEFGQLKRGDTIDAGTFQSGDIIAVVGHSKGRGFQGGVKRHGFHGHNTSHGTKDQVRMPGSIGAGEPQHVFKGTRMAGRMGNEQVTVQNLEVVEVNLADNTILIKGGLPGARNGLVLITGPGTLAVNKRQEAEPAPAAETPVIAEAKQEEPKAEVKPAEEPKAEIKNEEKAEPEKKAAKAGEKTEQPAVEVKNEEKKEDKKEEVKPVEPKAEKETPEKTGEEAVKEEVKAEATAKDSYLEKFKHLPKADQEKLSSPAVIAAITELEENHKMDLVSVLARLIVKEITEENLAAELIKLYKLDQPKADEIAGALKEKVLHLV